MSGEFIAALQLGINVKNAAGYTCICGLKVGISVDLIDPKQAGLVLAAAHAFHHAKHFGVPATLYMIGDPITAAQCSCEYDKEHPDVR